MLRCLVIYPNFLYENPTCRQFERFLFAIQDRYDLTLVTRHGPRNPAIDIKTVFITEKDRNWSYWGEFVKNHLGGLAQIPDEVRWSMNIPTRWTLNRLLKNQAGKYDFVMTLSFPLSCHFVGAYLKKTFRLPWVALFYDPWTDNPHRSSTNRFVKRMDACLERAVYSSADAIVHDNETIVNIWRNRYEKGETSKIAVIPFCYTDEMIQRPIAPSPGKETVVVSYIGLSNEGRNLHDLILAVEDLSKEMDISRLKVFVIGNRFDPDQQLCRSKSLDNTFSFEGYLPYSQLPSYYQSSDAFVVVDHPGQLNVHFPSKLMDYFLYQKPILGITPTVGATATLLREAGHTVVKNGDVGAVKEFLAHLLKEGARSFHFDKDYYRRFSPQNIAASFDGIIKGIISK
ncbi:MAG: glycosyltransferase [Bacteroidales bacterium]|nr:glycosyltransferase [Bacteroidales bacterium]